MDAFQATLGQYVAITVAKLFGNVSGELCNCISISACVIRFVNAEKKNIYKSVFMFASVLRFFKCGDNSVNVYRYRCAKNFKSLLL